MMMPALSSALDDSPASQHHLAVIVMVFPKHLTHLKASSSSCRTACCSSEDVTAPHASRLSGLLGVDGDNPMFRDGAAAR